MSGTAVRYGRVVGLVAAGALAFSMAPAGSAQADPTPTPSASVTPTDSPTPSPSDTSSPTPTASETATPTSEPTTASPAPTTTTPVPTKSPTPPPVPPSSCVITGYSPRSVTIAWKDVVEKFAVTYKSAPGKKCVSPSWWIGDGTADGDLADSSANYKYGTQFYHTTFRNKDAGWYDILVGLQSGNKPKEKLAVAHSTFSFLRATTWKSFDASPEPVKKGKKISLKGVVQRIDWDASAKSKKATYINLYAGATVDVQFRPRGSSTYTTLKVVKTATGGKVNTTITAARSGTWRLHFVTTTTTGYSTSKTDYVEVK